MNSAFHFKKVLYEIRYWVQFYNVITSVFTSFVHKIIIIYAVFASDIDLQII